MAPLLERWPWPCASHRLADRERDHPRSGDVLEHHISNARHIPRRVEVPRLVVDVESTLFVEVPIDVVPLHKIEWLIARGFAVAEQLIAASGQLPPAEPHPAIKVAHHSVGLTVSMHGDDHVRRVVPLGSQHRPCRRTLST